MHLIKRSLVIGFIMLALAPDSRADADFSFFVSSRNIFVLDGSISEKIGIGREIFGGGLDGSGHASRFTPYGFEFSYVGNRADLIGPQLRTRAAPFSIQPTSLSETVMGWDFQVQPGVRIGAYNYRSITFGFESGLTFRYFHSNDQDVVSSSNIAGLYLLGTAKCGDWSGEVEASPLALSFGSHGRWGTQRDSNLLRLRAERLMTESRSLSMFLEYHHIHRTFTGSQYGVSTSLFVSDLSMNLGVKYSL
jgi:hypothetical protein